MSEQEDTKQQQDTLNTQDNTESKYEKHDVPNTPFLIIQEPTEEVFDNFHVTLGRYRLSTHKTLGGAEDDAKAINWEKIIQIIGIIVENKENM